MLRHLAPKRIVEVGAGYSTAAMLDTSEQFLQQPPRYTIIEPYPQRLFALLKESDLAAITVRRQPVQDVDVSVFAQLEAGDLLFIDSSHVSKTASDVNFLFFEVIPRLAAGVHIQIHDIVYPFEYPKVWAYQGRAWNEAYLLRSCLQGSSTLKIELWGSYLLQLHYERYMASLPACRGESGGSIWLYRAL
jgi:predicted O-methyltransferase YrrM